jgi:quinol monooxygenase YgiN
MVIEKWANLGALQVHRTTPHMAAYAAKARPNIANRVVHVLSPAH